MNLSLNPDCKGGKHPACNGDAWDFDMDEPTTCQCPCHVDLLNPDGSVAA